MLAEAIQTVLRAHGVAGGYEKLKEFTRGRGVGAAELRQFVATLGLPDAARERLEKPDACLVHGPRRGARARH